MTRWLLLNLFVTSTVASVVILALGRAIVASYDPTLTLNTLP